MAQKLRDDKIGQLTHSAGNITMAASSSNPAYLTIGGQQYKITSNLSRLIASDVALAANSRYQVFAVVNSGSVELRISANENSVGPSGFNGWKLVGSFYSNGASAFGAFMNISGTPRTSGQISYTQNITGSGSNPSKTGTIVRDLAWWERVGDRMVWFWDFRMNTAGTNGSGNYQFPLPANILMDLTNLSSGTDGGADGFIVGRGQWNNNTMTQAHSAAYFVMNNSTLMIKWGASPFQVVNMTSWPFSQAHHFSFTCEAKISGWSNTPIEDL